MQSKDQISKFATVLEPYLPENVSGWVVEYLLEHKCKLKIAKGRSTRLGDYRHPYGDEGHRISINHDLNKFSFFITLLHEFAHLETWNLSKNSVLPHGIEWKNAYSKLISKFISANVFPDDIKAALLRQLHNPKATSCSDLPLMRVLANYNDETLGLHLETLEEGTVFKTDKNRVFTKGAKRKTRYICCEKKTGKYYLFHPLTLVNSLKTDD